MTPGSLSAVFCAWMCHSGTVTGSTGTSPSGLSHPVGFCLRPEGRLSRSENTLLLLLCVHTSVRGLNSISLAVNASSAPMKPYTQFSMTSPRNMTHCFPGSRQEIGTCARGVGTQRGDACRLYFYLFLLFLDCLLVVDSTEGFLKCYHILFHFPVLIIIEFFPFLSGLRPAEHSLNVAEMQQAWDIVMTHQEHHGKLV